jgi:regulatory protein
VGSSERAVELAFGHLGKRDRTEAELRRHLAAKDVGEPEADAAIAEVVRMGYLDDARYARTFAEDRRNLDGWGTERIERRLLALGVDREHIAAALGERDGADELEAAVELLRRRFRDGVLAGERERERALGMLVRKGYEVELAYDAVRTFERATAA